MDVFRRRFFSWLVLFGMIAGTGTLHRVWMRHWLSTAGAEEAQLREFREQARRMQEELNRLPPESKALVKDVLAAQRGEMMATPIVMRLSAFSSSGSEAPLEERVLAGARALGAAWETAQCWLARVLWLLAGVLVGLGAAGVVLDRAAWAALAGSWCRLVAGQWFLWMSLGCTIVFATLGHNPWFAMPATFYFLPAAILLAAFMLRLQESQPVEVALPEVLVPFSAPAASCALIACLKLVG